MFLFAKYMVFITGNLLVQLAPKDVFDHAKRTPIYIVMRYAYQTTLWAKWVVLIWANVSETNTEVTDQDKKDSLPPPYDSF
jgi:hypothetical protein